MMNHLSLEIQGEEGSEGDKMGQLKDEDDNIHLCYHWPGLAVQSGGGVTCSLMPGNKTQDYLKRPVSK